MNFLEQREKLVELLERASHNLNLEFLGNLVHNMRYKVDYHLINARVKYYSNSKNPRVIHTKLNNTHLVSLRTHPNQKYVVRTGDFLHLGPEDTINDILQYYESSLKALGIGGKNLDLSVFESACETVTVVGQCKVGKLVLLSSDLEADTPDQSNAFAGFDLNGDEQLETTPTGHNSSALCKESTTLNSTFQLTTASLRFDDHLRNLAEPKRQSSLKTLKREIMSRFRGDSLDLDDSKKEWRRLSLRRRKSSQSPLPELSCATNETEALLQEPSQNPAVCEDNDLIELSDESLKCFELSNGVESSEHSKENEKKVLGQAYTDENCGKLDAQHKHVKEKPLGAQVPKFHFLKDKPCRRSDIKVLTQVKKSFRVRGQATPNKRPQRFYDKLAKKEKAKKPWNTVYNEISLSAARLSTGSEGTCRSEYESLKSDLTESKRKESDVFAENLRQGKAKFHSPTIVRLTSSDTQL